MGDPSGPHKHQVALPTCVRPTIHRGNGNRATPRARPNRILLMVKDHEPKRRIRAATTPVRLTRRRSPFVAAFATLLIGASFVGVGQVRAEPSGTRIDGVFISSRCASETCDPATDPTLTPEASVSGRIQIAVSSSATLGLDWVRLEAQIPGDPRWLCVQQWSTDGALSFRGHHTWDTADWQKLSPEWGCTEASAHEHEPTMNVRHTLRVRAREIGSKTIEVSPPLSLWLGNPAKQPTWADEPRVTAGPNGEPTVKIAWTPNTEKDIAEYHIIRTSTSGTSTRSVVSATKAGDQDCRSFPRFECSDTTFKHVGRATYTYSIVALRPARRGNARCALANERCVRSPASPPRSVEVTTAGPATQGPSTGAHPSVQGTAPPSVTAGPTTDGTDLAPSGHALSPIPPAGSSPAPRQALLFLATIALLIAFRGLVRRRNHAHQRQD